MLKKFSRKREKELSRNKERITKLLDSLTSGYEESFPFAMENKLMHQTFATQLCTVLNCSQVESLLSLGIGHQIVINELVQNEHLYTSYHIVEGSSKIIQTLKRNVKLPDKVTIFESLFEEFQTDKLYDVIEMGFVLEHVDSPEMLLQKYLQMLRPGGLLIVAVPNARSMHRTLGLKAGLISDIYRLSKYDLELGHQRYYDMDRLTHLLTSHPIEIEQRIGLYLKPFTSKQLQKLELPESVHRALCSLGLEYPEIGSGMMVVARKNA